MRKRAITVPDPKVCPTLGVEEAGELLGFGRAKSYQEAARYIATDGAEGLPVMRFGRTLRVPTAALVRMLGLDESTP
jgi:hypothetical protein